jgi:hypothetical protein
MVSYRRPVRRKVAERSDSNILKRERETDLIRSDQYRAPISSSKYLDVACRVEGGEYSLLFPSLIQRKIKPILTQCARDPLETITGK